VCCPLCRDDICGEQLVDSYEWGIQQGILKNVIRYTINVTNDLIENMYLMFCLLQIDLHKVYSIEQVNVFKEKVKSHPQFTKQWNDIMASMVGERVYLKVSTHEHIDKQYFIFV
jgi:hypothetical protein